MISAGSLQFKSYLISLYLYQYGTSKAFKHMLVISSREFREKQAEYMDLADQGEQIIVQRGKNKAYAVTPISNDDVYFSKQMIEKIELSIQESQQGKTTKIVGKGALLNLLKGL